MKMKLVEIAEKLDAELVGDGELVIESVRDIKNADGGSLTFVADEKRYLGRLRESGAGAVITARRLDGDLGMGQLVVENVYRSLIESMRMFAPKLKMPVAGVDESARVGEGVKVGEGCCVGPNSVIEDGAELGDFTVIGSGCRIGERTKLGNHCRVDSNVVIYHDCKIGSYVKIKANSTIGSEGFGYHFVDGFHQHVPHNGDVVIEDFVDIGANSCIDRAKFGSTFIGAGTKIDNLVQVAHNVRVGRMCLLAGQAGIAGSTELGDGTVMGGQSGVIDNIKIGKQCVICVGSIPYGDVEDGKVVLGSPAIDRNEKLRLDVAGRSLPKLKKQLKEIVKRIERLETSKDD